MCIVYCIYDRFDHDVVGTFSYIVYIQKKYIGNGKLLRENAFLYKVYTIHKPTIK